MVHCSKTSKTTTSSVLPKVQGLVWNADLTLLDDQASLQRRRAIEQARAGRPRTAQIEREIMIAVIVLYVLILGSFASLHLYGEYVMPEQVHQAEQTEAAKTEVEP